MGTYNPNHNINLKKIHCFLDRIKNKELKTYLQKKKALLSSRQAPNVHKLLTTAKFVRLPIPTERKQIPFFFLELTASIIKMVILKNFYHFC